MPERLRKALKADAEISGALLDGLIEPDINRVKDPGVWLQPSAGGRAACERGCDTSWG